MSSRHPNGASGAELKKRALTNLYNVKPSWLFHAHASLGRAVCAACGWDDPDPATGDEVPPCTPKPLRTITTNGTL